MRFFSRHSESSKWSFFVQPVRVHPARGGCPYTEFRVMARRSGDPRSPCHHISTFFERRAAESFVRNEAPHLSDRQIIQADTDDEMNPCW